MMNNKPFVFHKFFYIPFDSLFSTHSEYASLLSIKKTFNNNNDCYIEFCSGNGQWIVNKAINNPKINWIAVEKKFSRAFKIYKKLINNNLPNLLIINTDGGVLHNYLPLNTIKNIYINFPDPWPKRKHLKHRLINFDFLKNLQKYLQKDSSIIISTDDINLINYTLKIFLESNLFQSYFASPFYTNDWTNYGDSFFKNLWLSKNKKIYYLKFIKKID